MLRVRIQEIGTCKIAICDSDEIIIEDGQSALEFAVNIGHEHDCHNIVLNKAAITEDFFMLTTGVAGEVAQKLVNYGYRLAIIGDFSEYTSVPLRDYMHECNKGRHIFFVNNEQEALKKLTGTMPR